jgi:hypothetical protein
VKTEDVLVERGKRYGNYLEQTKISDALTTALVDGAGDKRLETDQEDALFMICVKMARIINGDPDYADNWRDIAGYATLVAERLEGIERKQDS